MVSAKSSGQQTIISRSLHRASLAILQILKTFKSKLANKNISTEAFKFEGATPPAAEYRRVVTNEGITLLFSAGHEENKNVEIKDEDNGGVEITIRSTGLERDDELEKMPRIPD